MISSYTIILEPIKAYLKKENGSFANLNDKRRNRSKLPTCYSQLMLYGLVRLHL